MTEQKDYIDHFYFVDDPNTIFYLKEDGYIDHKIILNQTNTVQKPNDDFSSPNISTESDGQE